MSNHPEEKRSKHYDRGRLVELLLDPTLDLRATAVRLAQEQPGMFIRLAVTAAAQADMRMQQVYNLLRPDPAENYVKAVKLHRELFQSSLKDAVDAVRPLKDQLLGVAA